MMGCMPRDSLFRPFWSRLPCERLSFLRPHTSSDPLPSVVCFQ